MLKYFSIIILPLLLILVLLPSSAFATERYEYYNSTREMAMGGASIAVVNDETALIANPAGLGKLRNTIGTIITPETEFSNENLTTWKKANINDISNMEGIKKILQENPDKHYHFNTQTFPALVVPNFGIGLLAKYSFDARFNETDNTYTFNYLNDYAFYLGYNFRLFGGRMKAGFNLKYLNRAQIKNRTLPTDNTEDYKVSDYYNAGTGIGSDFGLILTAPWKTLPTLSLVLRNFGDTYFTMDGGKIASTETRPTPLKQDLDIAIAFFPIFSNKVRSSFTFEYKDILTAEDIDSQKSRSHLGMEINFSDVFFLRAGINQGYWTAGYEFATEHLQFQLTSYGEEIGTADQPEEDRRIMFKFTFRY